MNSKLNNIINELIKKYNLDSLDITENSRELVIMLLSEIKNCSIANIKLDLVKIEDKDINKLECMLKKISLEKVPPQYITSREYIYGNSFFVNENVLIPRQDTETLIEQAINLINKNQYTSLLDMCTGSGIIGINLAIYTDVKDVTMVDLSKEALQVARKNILLHGQDSKCKLLQSDMFKNLYDLNNKYDIIVSNPPYLTKQEMNNISEFVQKEPSIALYGGRDGLEYYKIIYNEAKNFLNNNASIVVEIGMNQAQDIIDIITCHKQYDNISVVQDINNKNRVIICRFQNR